MKKIILLTLTFWITAHASVVLAQPTAPAAGGETPAAVKQEIILLQELPAGGNIQTAKGAIHIVEQAVQKVYAFGSALVAIVAVIWIIIGGYEIMFSGALGSGSNSAGKEKITQALLGLVILFLAALILNTINPDFFTLRNDTASDSPLGR